MVETPRPAGAGKTLEFTAVGEVTLKGFDEPVALDGVGARGRGVEGTSG